jgi:hypothetical protein
MNSVFTFFISATYERVLPLLNGQQCIKLAAFAARFRDALASEFRN